MAIDPAKYDYFLSRYKGFDEEELRELAEREESLAEEARQALQDVYGSVRHKPIKNGDLSGEGRSEATRDVEDEKALASKLRNSPLAKRVENLIAAQALMFSYALLGPQGLRVGVIVLVVVAGVLVYGARKVGRNVTRQICANADVSIQEKSKKMKMLSYWLWPLMLVPAFIGTAIAAVLIRVI